MNVNHSARSGGMKGISFRFSFTLRYVVCSHQNCLVETILMSTHNIPFSIKKNENPPRWFQICSCGMFSKGLKNEFETAVVNRSSVFEPLKDYCTVIKTPFKVSIAVVSIIHK